MTMEASERDWKKSRRGFPLASSVDRARPRKVAKLTRPMMFIALACSYAMSHSDFGGTGGGGEKVKRVQEGGGKEEKECTGQDGAKPQLG